jgi:hypothetical protein
MQDVRTHLRSVRQRPAMYQLVDGSFDSVVTYVQGLDASTSWGMLTGFYEFLLLHLGEQSNLAWSGLVEWLAFPNGVPRPRTAAEEAVATATLFDLLDEFLAEFSAGHTSYVACITST